MYPIMMTTYNRPDYFNRSIISLKDTGVDLSMFHIFDDCSTDTKKIKMLDSLEKKYSVHISKKNLGTTLNTIPNIDYMFNKYDSEYVVLLQDDILFSKNWLKNGIDIFDQIKYEHNNVGYLSLFNRSRNNIDLYYIMSTGHPGGVAIIFDRKFWEEYKKRYDINDYCVDNYNSVDKKREHFIKNVYDYKLAIRCVSMGWKLSYVGKSLVLHIGNLCSMPDGKDKTYIHEECKRNFVGFDK